MQYTVRTRAVSRGLARIEPFGSVLVAYAAKDGTTAEDGDGNHSPFSAALLKYLEQPGLEINFLFRNVRDDVLVRTAHRQEPFVYGSLSKEAIYLKPPIERLGTEFIPAPPPGPTPDEIAWSFLKDSKDIAALKRFVAEFPNSKETAGASQRIALLESEAARDEATRRTAERRELARALQLELKRIGCFDGAIDGELGDATRVALQRFAKLSSVRLPDGEPSSDALYALRRFDRRVCPVVCPDGERADNEKCVRVTCPTGQVLKGSSCIGKPTADRDTAVRRTPPPAASASSGAKCFSFQGRRFCE